jgi:septal ring factor EnvC (AmiA/AmiB activator)
MGFRDIARSLRPGDDRALAVQLQREQEARARQKRAQQRADAKLIAERDAQRTVEEMKASRARGRRSKRGGYEEPARGVNP